MDFLRDDLQQDFVIDCVKCRSEVALDIPLRSSPAIGYRTQSGMTASTWSKPMRMVRKLHIEVSFHDGAHYLLEQFIGPAWQA